jgi:hypothetical protein
MLERPASRRRPRSGVDTRPDGGDRPGMWRTLIAAVTLVLLLIPSSGVAGERGDGVIPWLPTRPRPAPEPPLSLPCRAADLRARLDVQGATGNLIGGVVVRNAGAAPCSLRGRPSARFEGGPASETALSVFPASADALDTSLIYDPGSSLRALRPGRTAFLPVFWSNWCPPGVVVTTPGKPPSSLVLVLPSGGEVAAAVRGGPRCDTPAAPSTLAIKPFVRRGRQPLESSHLPLRAEIVNATTDKRQPPRHRVEAGGVLRYDVAVMNVSRRPFRFRGCPTYIQRLVRQRSERYVLNCRPVGVVQPSETVRFEMRLRAPNSIRPGRTGLFWLLGPKTYLPTTTDAVVLVTR